MQVGAAPVQGGAAPVQGGAAPVQGALEHCSRVLRLLWSAAPEYSRVLQSIAQECPDCSGVPRLLRSAAPGLLQSALSYFKLTVAHQGQIDYILPNLPPFIP